MIYSNINGTTATSFSINNGNGQLNCGVINSKGNITTTGSINASGDITAPNLAYKNNTLQHNLYSEYCNFPKNPNDGLGYGGEDSTKIFYDPPLSSMAKFSYNYSEFNTNEVKNPDKTKLPPYYNPNTNLCYNTITMSTRYTRALQFTTQTFIGKNVGGRTFMRTRHVDDNNFTHWQAWREVATADSADLNRHLLATHANYQNWNSDRSVALQYQKTGDGRFVCIWGIIKPVANHTPVNEDVMFTLPAGFRPFTSAWYTICSLSGGGYRYRLSIGSDGRGSLQGLIAEAVNSAKSSIEVNTIFPIDYPQSGY